MCTDNTILRQELTKMYAKIRHLSDWIERHFGWFFTNGNKVRMEAAEFEFERLSRERFNA